MSKPKSLTNDQLAELFYLHHEDIPRLNYLLYNNLVYCYKDGIYALLDEKDHLTRDMFHFALNLKREGELSSTKNITQQMIKDAVSSLKLFITNTPDDLEVNYLALNDGNLIDLSSKPFSICPQDREKIAFTKLNISASQFLKSSSPSRFLTFLSQILVQEQDQNTPDQELIDFVQEMFGYCLLSSVRAESAFFLFGGGANGKSVLLDILKAMFPPHLIASSSLESLTTNQFRLSSLLGKQLNVVNEEESRYIKSDVFKNLVTGGPMTIERKFMDSITAPLNLKMLFATNNLPTFSGVDKAMRRRLKIIPFYATIPDDSRDPFLAKNIIQAELPQIIAWALVGADRLIQRKYQFPKPKAMKRISSVFEQAQSSPIEFFEENYQITTSPYDMILKSHMFRAYSGWCEQVKRKAVMKSSFLKDLSVRYSEDGLNVPDEAIYLAPLKRTARVVQFAKPTDDESAWIHNEGDFYVTGSDEIQTQDSD